MTGVAPVGVSRTAMDSLVSAGSVTGIWVGSWGTKLLMPRDSVTWPLVVMVVVGTEGRASAWPAAASSNSSWITWAMISVSVSEMNLWPLAMRAFLSWR